MAKYNPEYTAPSATQLSELYYATTESGAAKQIFGVQGIPRIQEPSEDITYRTLESDEEFGAPGIKPFSALEVTLLLYKEQHEQLKALDGQTLWWYVKYPDEYGIIRKWQGKMAYILESLELDDMCKSVLKIYKATTPEEVSTIPAT